MRIVKKFLEKYEDSINIAFVVGLFIFCIVFWFIVIPA